MHLPALITDLALMLLVAGACTLLFKKLRQPLVLGYIIAGIIVGPYFNLFPAVTDTVSIQTWSEIGIIILMFSLGLEFNLHKLASVGSTAIITAIIELVFMLAIGFACGQLMGWGTMNSIFLGGMLSMSSTTIIIKAFDDLCLKGNKFTDLVFGTLIVEDIAGIFMMVMLSTVALSQGIQGGELMGSLLKMVLYLVLWILLGIYLLPSILKKLEKLMNDETLLIISLGICLGMVLLANYFGFSSALGAFLAGSLLAGTNRAEKIEHITRPIKDLFGAIFFISVGMLVNPAVIVKYVWPIVIISLVAIIGKAVFSALGVLLSGQCLKTATLCGFSLAQIGEFSFIIASLGISLGVLDDFIYPIIVSVSVITTFTTPFVIRSAEGVYTLLNKRLPPKVCNYLNRNTSEDQAETEKDNDWSAFVKKYFSRLVLDVVIIVSIIFSGTSFLWPFLAAHLDATLAAILSSLATLILMAPFLKQCLFQKNEYFIPLWFKARTNRLPLIVLHGFRLVVMVFLVMLPIRIMFDFSVFYILFVAVALIFFIIRFDWLTAPYLKIEARFMANFNERQLQQRKEAGDHHNWLDEKIYVSRIELTPQSTALRQSLAEISGSKRSNLKIIKIIRGHKHINIPEKTEKLLPGDVVFLVGKVAELNNFEIIANRNETVKQGGHFVTLRDFINHQEQCAEADQLLCYAVTVEKNSMLAGCAVKDSVIKSECGGFLLGLERNLYPTVFPNVNMRIREGDLLWVLGSQKMVGTLTKFDLL